MRKYNAQLYQITQTREQFEQILTRLDGLKSQLDLLIKSSSNSPTSPDQAITLLAGIVDKLKSKSELVRLKINLIELPSWVDAELFEQHLHYCAAQGKPVNEEAQTNKLKQLETAHQKGLDVHVIQANAVGGGWLNFYPASEKETGATEHLYSILDKLKAKSAKS